MEADNGNDDDIEHRLKEARRQNQILRDLARNLCLVLSEILEALPEEDLKNEPNAIRAKALMDRVMADLQRLDN